MRRVERISWLGIALFALAVVGVPRAAQCQTPAGDARSRSFGALSLAPGDILKITVWRQPEFSCDCVVAADGTVTHPLYRTLKVEGLPMSTVEDRLRELLTHYVENPAFVMIPQFRIVVGGEVHQPNVYTVPAGTTVAAAVALAGGVTDRGRLDDVHVLRKLTTFTLNLTRPDSAALETQIRSGDQILVERRRSIMQDIILPSSSILAAAGALAGVIIQLNRR